MNLLNIENMQVGIFSGIASFHQSSKCQARLTTKNDEIISSCDPEHNRFGNKKNILARQAVVEMKDKMSDISTTPSAVIAPVATQLEPDVLMAGVVNGPTSSGPNPARTRKRI